MKYKQALSFARQLRKNQTPAEVFFWKKVRAKRFFSKKFLRQFIIEYQEILDEKSFYIVDFYCAEKRLIVELDGGIHLQRKEVDAVRQKVLEDMEYKVVRFKNEEVLENWNEVEKQLKEILQI